jgi:hypothetical protein
VVTSIPTSSLNYALSFVRHCLFSTLSTHPLFSWEGVIAGCRKLHNEKTHNIYSFPNTITTKSRRMRLLGHAARVGDSLFRYKRLKEGDYLEYIKVDKSIILIWIFKKCKSKWLTEFMWLSMAKWPASVNAVMTLSFQNARNFLTSCITSSF